ncbi:GNAT family N-acetyltransferase [Xylogone sp. PMI_703]|nr:GNAT family N-acetyltransferase [Xylogone sp. PMI_703]
MEIDDTVKVKTPSYIIRSHRPGDMGWIVHRHGVLYNQEYGWNEHFEAIVARIAADFIENFNPKSERCWIADRDGEFLGCVMLVKDKELEDVARLRLLLVEPGARGLGLGRTLIQQCTQFAREVGYKQIQLWTRSILTSARHLYTTEGYTLTKTEENETLGTMGAEENWELKL